MRAQSRKNLRPSIGKHAAKTSPETRPNDPFRTKAKRIGIDSDGMESDWMGGNGTRNAAKHRAPLGLSRIFRRLFQHFPDPGPGGFGQSDRRFRFHRVGSFPRGPADGRKFLPESGAMAAHQQVHPHGHAAAKRQSAIEGFGYDPADLPTIRHPFGHGSPFPPHEPAASQRRSRQFRSPIRARYSITQQLDDVMPSSLRISSVDRPSISRIMKASACRSGISERQR
jgi:hypothetical protein